MAPCQTGSLKFRSAPSAHIHWNAELSKRGRSGGGGLTVNGGQGASRLSQMLCGCSSVSAVQRHMRMCMCGVVWSRREGRPGFFAAGFILKFRSSLFVFLFGYLRGALIGENKRVCVQQTCLRFCLCSHNPNRIHLSSF